MLCDGCTSLEFDRHYCYQMEFDVGCECDECWPEKDAKWPEKEVSKWAH